jgi:hypothetical protein
MQSNSVWYSHLFRCVQFFTISFFFCLFLFTPSVFHPVYANSPGCTGANCTISSGTYTMTTGEVDGADGGTLTVSGGTLTVNGGTLVYGSTLIVSGAPLTITSGIVTNGAICMTDADGDHYPANTTQTASNVCSSPYVNRSSLTSLSLIDCNDTAGAGVSINPGASDANCNGVDDDCNTVVDNGYTNTTYYRDYDGDGYGDSSNSISQCSTSGTPVGYVTNNTDCNDTGSFSQYVYKTASTTCYPDADDDGAGVSSSSYTCIGPNTTDCYSATWASNGNGSQAVTSNFSQVSWDCQDTGTNANLVSRGGQYCYRDQDNDSYGSATSYTCMSGLNCNTATAGSNGEGTSVVTSDFTDLNNTDCCDTDANAHPDQTNWYSTPRNSCGGYDYNCVNGEEKNTAGQTPTYDGAGKTCTAGNDCSIGACTGAGTNRCSANSGAAACGAAITTCNTSTGKQCSKTSGSGCYACFINTVATNQQCH